MKILYCKTFGIGNAVMAVPTIKAIASVHGPVDILVGTGPDDVGAWNVFHKLGMSFQGVVGSLIPNSVPDGMKHDVAVMSIPYDGRWLNGRDFFAEKTMDGRTRPDPTTTGFSSWKKHEALYQLDNAIELGYKGDLPSCSFMKQELTRKPKRFYFGVGYKKDAAGFWATKHWGNDNFAKLANIILKMDPENEIVMTGDMKDLKFSISEIIRKTNSSRIRYVQGNIPDAFDVISECSTYVGNDTGMMHIAASLGLKTIGIFKMENLTVKNSPLCDENTCIDASVDEVTAEDVVKLGGL